MELDELFDFDVATLEGVLDDAFIFSPPAAPSVAPSDDRGAESGERYGEHAQTVAPEPRRPPMKNPSRERIKQELGFLRGRVVELEQEITSLSATPKRSFAAISGSLDSIATGSWKSVAEEERGKRRSAELENERLRHTLETQLSLARELTTYLSHRAAPNSVVGDAVTHIPPMLFSSFNFVTAQLLRDVDRAYAVTDSMFGHTKWESLPDAHTFETSVKTNRYKHGDQMCIELRDSAYRPQPYEQASKAAWEATRQVYANEERVTNRGISTEDVISTRYRGLGRTRGGLSKNLVVTFVAKKFVEPARTVFVWRSCVSPATHDADMPMQALSDETGWAILTRVPEGNPTRAAGTAFFQAVSHLVPLWFEDDVVDSSVRTQLAIGEFTNVVLSAAEADAVGLENAFQLLVLGDPGHSSSESGHSSST